jgi:hypothetical protein
MDKRTKEYKDSIGNKEPEVLSESEAMSTMRKELLELKELMKTMGEVTANNAKAIKDGKTSTIKVKAGIKRPRAAELAILIDFLDQFQGMLAYDKDLCGKIALNSIMRPNVDALNEVIKKQGQLNKKAIEIGLYENNDFKTIKIQNK